MRRFLFYLSPILPMALLIAVAILGCGPTEATKPAVQEPREYPISGTVMGVFPHSRSIELKHHDIAGLMPAMEMEFNVSDAVTSLSDFRNGDEVEGTLHVSGNGVLEITDLHKVGH